LRGCINWALVAGPPCSRQLAAAGDGLNAAIDRHFSHAGVPQVGDIEIAGLVHRESVRLVEKRGASRSTIARVTGHTSAGDGLDGTVRRNLEHLIVGCIGDVDVAGAIHRDAFRLAQRGGEGLAAIA
jgi:hypothetical protein